MSETPATDTPTDTEPVDTEQSSGGSSLITVLIIALVVAAAGGGYWYFKFGRNKKHARKEGGEGIHPRSAQGCGEGKSCAAKAGQAEI